MKQKGPRKPGALNAQTRKHFLPVAEPQANSIRILIQAGFM